MEFSIHLEEERFGPLVFSVIQMPYRVLSRNNKVLAFNEESFGAARLPAIHTVPPRLDEHVCYRYASTLKYRSVPHKLSKPRV